MTRVLILIAVLLSLPVYSQSGFSCANIEDDVNRLSCFDAIYPSNNRDIAQGNDAVGFWHIETDISPIDDSINLLAYVKSDQDDSVYNPSPRLFIRCNDGEEDVFFGFHERLMENPKHRSQVVLRVDKNDAFDATLVIGKDHKAVFIDKPKKFIFGLIDSDTVAIRVNYHYKAPQSYVFKLDGIKDMIEKYRFACGW